MKKLSRILLALIPAALVFLMIVAEPFYSLDAMLTDKVYSQMKGIGDTIKIIAIDEETLAEYGPLNTWSREKSADLIEYLCDGENDPSVLAFDLMFIGETDSEVDNRLAAAATGKNIITASNLVYRGATRYNKDGSPYYDKKNIETEERPYTSLDEVSLSGYANAEMSKDGFVRTTQFSTIVGNETRYSFATRIYLEYMKKAGLEERALATITKDNQVQFFYSGKPGEVTRFSLKNVLDGKIPKEEFKDSIVIVGAYAPGLMDSYHSAAKRNKDMYGAEINANIVNALLNEKTATKAPVIWYALISALALFAYTYMAREMKMYPALLVGLWVLMGFGIAGRVLAVNGSLISLVYVLIAVLLVAAWVIIEKYVLEIFQKKKVIDTFKKYMAPQVIDNMAKDELFNIEMKGQRKHVAVLFVDIRGFTSMSEVLDPEEVVQILNQYLSLTTKCIFDHGGMLDKFIGDATMAIFNAPNDQEDYIYKAILAGLDMVKYGDELGKKLLEQYGRTVSFGVGVNIGEAIVGNIGCETRLDYTAIGDTVNTASRIEGKAKGGELLITEDTMKSLEGRIVTEYVEAMSLKGKAEPVNVYRVLGIID